MKKLFVLVLLIFTFGTKAQFDNTRQVAGISISYCYSFDYNNYISVDGQYNVYYLTLLGYPVSSLDVYGGVSVQGDSNFSQNTFGYHIGIKWNFLFISAVPEYRNGFVLYDNYRTCYMYAGVNVPIWKEENSNVWR